MENVNAEFQTGIRIIMANRNSLRSISEFMDSRNSTNSLREVIKKHRLPGSVSASELSFRTVADRHTSVSSRDIRFLFYNTWLLQGFVGIGDKPLVGTRSYLIGQELKSTGYDIAALCEVFDEGSQERISHESSFPNYEVGPLSTIGKKSSGLMTLSKYRITRFNRHRFEDRGSGTDWWSNKGVLHTVISLWPGNIDLYTTHLVYGSTSKELPARTKDRLNQLIELRSFIGDTHNLDHVAIIAGDLNINADSNHPDGDAYRRLIRHVKNIPLKKGGQISFADLWPLRGGKSGGTNESYRKCQNRLVEDNIIYCDDEETGKEKNEGRLDYIFVQEPAQEHKMNLDFTRLKRRPFPVPDLKVHQIPIVINELMRPEEIESLSSMSESDLARVLTNFIRDQCQQHAEDDVGHLSDHLGLEVTFLASSR